MEHTQLSSWQAMILTILYIGYLCWVMFGGLRKRRVKPAVSGIMTALLLYGVVNTFTGIHTIAEILDLGIVLMIGFIKGIVLGRRKVVEKIDGTWYMRHDGRYILLWVAFFAGKVLLTQVLQLVTHTQFPMWHMILYFCFYYPWRTIHVFQHHPEMRKETLARHR